jgi:outer membrane receptor for ferrienterochelin and colicin
MPDGTRLYRQLLVDEATFADQAVLRMGTYNLSIPLGVGDNIYGGSDSLFIKKATAAGGETHIYFELGWVPGMEESPIGYAVKGGDSPTIGILESVGDFTVEGRTSRADGIFSQYEITPVVSRLDDFFQAPGESNPDAPGTMGTGWVLDSYSYADTGELSKSATNANDNFLAADNIFKTSYVNMFRGLDSFHKNVWPGRLSFPGAKNLAGSEYYRGEYDEKENVWAEAWHGESKGGAGYGGSLNQNYNGWQIGYDKLLKPEIAGGRVYAGFYLSRFEGRSHTAEGSGKQFANGIAAYASWLGEGGHYLDLGLTASRINNDYHFIGNTGFGIPGKIEGSHSAWSYGIGAQYGKQNLLSKGWFYEPTLALFYGHINGSDYTLSNSLKIRVSPYDTLTGKLGLNIGKEFDGQGNIYAGAAVYHDFAGNASVTGTYGPTTRHLYTGGGHDTWLEFNLGGHIRLAKNNVFNLNLSKTSGKETGSEWKISGGLNWSWGGGWDKEGNRISGGPLPEINTGTTVIVGRPAEAAQTTESGADTSTGDIATQTAGETTGQAAATDVPAETQEGGGYTLPGLTVEADRPAWEKALSPGQVSVIYPSEFAGEQNDLPDLLERTPGLFVQRVSGDGHYTVARVRGSTGAQVNVYVDGVLMNLNGEAAVNLSTIPVDNVERVEVYRGYVPARFSGSPLGGVINIVTKKPLKLGGRASQGVRSYGGYTGSYELTAPLGKGSVMATFQHDQWDGDFPFTVLPFIGATPDPFDTNRRSNGYDNKNGMVKWQDGHWTVKAAWKDLDEELPRSLSRLTYNHPTTMELYNKGYYDAEQKIKEHELQVGWQGTAGSLDWGWKLYYLKQKKDYRGTGFYKGIADGYWTYDGLNNINWAGWLWTAFDSRKAGVNLNAALKLGRSHLLEVNFDYSDETMKADGSAWDKWNSNPFHERWNRLYINKYKIQEYHLTVQDSISLNQAGDFKLTPIFRADRVAMDTMNDGDHKWKYSGAVALQKQLDQNWSFKTSVGTYNRHPNFYELFGDGATIRPNDEATNAFGLDGRGTWESGNQFDFSINWQGRLAKADTDTVVTWFQRDAKNQLTLWTPNVANAPSTYFPMANSHVEGLELTHSMKWRRVGLSLAATLQRSRGSIDGITFSGLARNIAYTPEKVLNARLDYIFPGDKLSMFAEFHYTDKQSIGISEDDESSLDSLQTVNFGAKYAFGKGWKLSAGVNDLFDKGRDMRMRWAGRTLTPNHPLTGRTYYATLEYSF